MEFDCASAAIKCYCSMLLRTNEIPSTNVVNEESYKKKIGGEVMQEFFAIKNPFKIFSTWKNHKFYKWWLYSEILTEVLGLEQPLMYKYRPDLYNQHYQLLEDNRMQYSYGNRFLEFNQFVNIYNKLKKNINSKRCVVQIYTPYDNSPDRNDAPCTLGYSFIHRNGKLNMTVFYRSWDFFGGFKTYDFGLSSFILQMVSAWLNVRPGKLCFYVTSLHYYGRDHKCMNELYQEVNGRSAKKGNDFCLGVDKINITQFYNELRLVKLIEEASYFKNDIEAQVLLKKLTIPLLIDMGNVFIKKNNTIDKKV